MPNVDPKQLEQEADELIRSLSGAPPEAVKPDTEAPIEAAIEDEPPAEELEVKKPDESAPAVADTDELDGLTLENMAERVRNAQARMHRATQEAAVDRRSLSDAQRDLQTLEADVERLQDALEQAMAKQASPPAKADSGQDTATLESLIDEYPTIIGPILARLKVMEGKVSAVEGSVTQQAQTETQNRERAAQEAHFNAIKAAHPDYISVANSEEFQGWLDRQPGAYRIFLYGDGLAKSRTSKGGSAAEIISVFNAYSRAIGKTKQTAEAIDASTPSLRRANTNPTKARVTFTQAQIKAMPPEEYAKREAEIDLAMAEGRIT